MDERSARSTLGLIAGAAAGVMMIGALVNAACDVLIAFPAY